MFQKLLCHGETLYIFKSSSRVFRTSDHRVLILPSIELQWDLHLRLFDIINETRRDLCSKKIQLIVSAPHFIYFSKGSPVLLHRSRTNTDCICKWFVNDEENIFLKRFETQLNLKITVYSLTCYRWADSLINHRHRVTYRL